MALGARVMHSSKNREARRSDLSDRVMDVAFELFMEQGYEKTTMRKVATKAGVLTGSVYNLFDSKDAIFESMFIRNFELLLPFYRESVGDDCDIMTSIAFPVCLMIHYSTKHDRMRELIDISNKSWRISTSVIEMMSGMIVEHFNRYGMTQSIENVCYCYRVVLGAASSMADVVHHEGRIDLDREYRTVLELFCALFRFPMMDVDASTERLKKVIGRFDALLPENLR